MTASAILKAAPLRLRRIATLDVAAASGIALRAGALYVIADDELDLAVYDPSGERLGRVALRPGALPDEHASRKAKKPDFEALLQLPDDSLLALGSGSTAQRARGAWVRFERELVRVEPVDLSPLYDALATELSELNVEGGAVLHDTLFLASRGNGARGEDALIQLDLRDVRERLARDRVVAGSALSGIVRVALPELDGTPLSLTDLAPAGDRLLFTAAAEASASTYHDGRCEGSALGSMTASGTIVRIARVEPSCKLEGLCVQPESRGQRLWLVADADDRAQFAPLFQVDWSSHAER